MHSGSRKYHFSNSPLMDHHAVGMVKHLQKAGHTAYLVGGCVRDLLVDQVPKDFDIGTSALPQEVRKLINFAFIIGKRFRLTLVKRGDRQYEISTFRREADPDEFPEGIPFGDNIFGTPEQDAFRRDFTCNALFYDPVKDELIDFVDGQQDVMDHVIRMIGDPEKRLTEDPIRILRALRFAHKLHFKLDAKLRHKMHDHAESLKTSILPRKREEYLKLLRLSDAVAAFRHGHDLQLWKYALPKLNTVYENEEHLDIFEEKLHRLVTRLIDGSDTCLLLGAFMLALIRARSKNPNSEEIINHSTEEYTRVENFAKKDLGIFNWEWARIHKAISLQKTLAKPEEFMRKGHRRKMAFLSSDAFPLAVDLSFIDAHLDPDILDYWDEQLSLLRH
ncbi:MAG: poly(A) polymerase [Oligoflexia bacterium]|nr:poly(A) polymerase [Oligoflexia bacterium]